MASDPVDGLFERNRALAALQSDGRGSAAESYAPHRAATLCTVTGRRDGLPVRPRRWATPAEADDAKRCVYSVQCQAVREAVVRRLSQIAIGDGKPAGSDAVARPQARTAAFPVAALCCARLHTWLSSAVSSVGTCALAARSRWSDVGGLSLAVARFTDIHQ